MNMVIQPFHRLRSLPAVLLLIALAACKVTADDIETWKGTVKGPGKLVAVMLSETYPMDLRTKAALALVDMERTDVDGVGELQRSLQRVEESTRAEIITGMTPGLKALMAGGEEEIARQIRAKDAAYLLIAQAPDGARDELVKAVVGWFVVDFNGRNLAGNYIAEQVVKSLGSPAASMLVDAMSSKMPQPALVKIAELIGTLADDEGKARAAERLLAIQEEMAGDEFLTWLKTEIREQIKKARPDSEINEAYVTETAEINREKFLNDGAIPAMKHLAGVESVANRLLELAELEGTDAKVVDRRKRALQALEGSAKQSHLARLLALATGQHPIPVRDYAFDRIGDIRSKDAIPAMWPLVQNTEDGRLRWRAAELVLHLGGPDVVREFFGKLPTGEEIKYEPEELEGYASRMSQMNPPPTALVKGQLASTDWWDRIIALRYLERRGTEADIAGMQRLARDSVATAGEHWADNLGTVGKVAEDAITRLRERLTNPSEEAEES